MQHPAGMQYIGVADAPPCACLGAATPEAIRHMADITKDAHIAVGAYMVLTIHICFCDHELLTYQLQPELHYLCSQTNAVTWYCYLASVFDDNKAEPTCN